MKRGTTTVAVAGLTLALAAPAIAQELKIGLASEATSMDPHFHNLGPNNALRRHIFDALTTTDENQKLVPSLAESWRAIDDTTWEFKLRKGVTFSNGTPFTAQDVIYTFCRVPTVENSPSSFTSFVRPVQSVEMPDQHTMIFKTAAPVPLLPNLFNSVGILSAKAFGGEGVKFKAGGCENLSAMPKSAEFTDTAKAVGTGPYKLANYTRGTHVVVERNETYWGPKQHWAKVTFRPIASEGPRVAALLAGDVDLVETPPIQDFDKIKAAGFTITQGLSNRVIYLHLDQHGDPAWKTPGVKGTDKNPFLDKRVREAISKAINRPAIVERIMGGVAVAAGELLPVPLFGTSPDRKPDTFNLDAAKKLLAEAGFPNGFEVTLGTPNDRYINDEKVAQAVAQMLTRAGLKVNVDAMTASTFFSRRNKFEFSMYLAGWGADSGEMLNPLVSLVATMNPQTGLGSTNRGRYSNKELDAVIAEASKTIDDAKREELLRKGSKIVMDDYGIIPLHFEVTPWAFRKGLAYKARVDQYTLATDLAPAN
jgi:peptide/nickel transport system substrate-binding protein